jgi:hypothetical protein
MNSAGCEDQDRCCIPATEGPGCCDTPPPPRLTLYICCSAISAKSRASGRRGLMWVRK